MKEKHAKNHQHLHDFVLGFADGLTVPFALTVGLSGLGARKLVIIGGLAELFSGSLSMGLGAYLASITDRQQYQTELRRELDEVEETPEQEMEEVYEILCSYGPDRQTAKPYVEALCKNKRQWVQFMMDLELKIDQPRRRDAVWSGVTMGMAYLFGGILPMIPYFVLTNVYHALYTSIGVTFSILVLFGYLKASLFGATALQSFKSAVYTLAIGAAAAGASYGIVYGMNHSSI